MGLLRQTLSLQPLGSEKFLYEIVREYSHTQDLVTLYQRRNKELLENTPIINQEYAYGVLKFCAQAPLGDNLMDAIESAVEDFYKNYDMHCDIIAEDLHERGEVVSFMFRND